MSRLDTGNFILQSSPKNPSSQEDAKPILLVKENKYLLGVFDGLGGAGGKVIVGPQGERTSAFYGARLVRKVVREYFKRYFDQLLTKNVEKEKAISDIANELSRVIEGELIKFANAHEGSPSRLKTGLKRRLPTTLALWEVEPTEDSIIANCYWAGDSRLYAVTPHHGLVQFSEDDLVGSPDALENIIQDRKMSNYIYADSEVDIRCNSLTILYPVIIFAATDGCFQYFESPMHFEYSLLHSMMKSKSFNGWQELLNINISEVTEDDSTMALACFGWDSFNSLQASFKNRYKKLKDIYIKDYDKMRKIEYGLIRNQALLSEQINEHRERMLELRVSLWNQYSVSYNQVLKEYERTKNSMDLKKSLGKTEDLREVN